MGQAKMKSTRVNAKAWVACLACAVALAGCASKPVCAPEKTEAPAPAAAPTPVTEDLPLVSNDAAPPSVSWDKMPPAPRLGFDQARMDRLALGAASQAVVELKCSPGAFEQRSLAVGKKLDAMARKQGGAKGAKYAKDLAVATYETLARSKSGLDCADMGPLRAVARAGGFGEAAKKPAAKKTATAKSSKR